MAALPCWCSDTSEHAVDQPCPTREHWLDVEDSELGDA